MNKAAGRLQPGSIAARAAAFWQWKLVLGAALTVLFFDGYTLLGRNSLFVRRIVPFSAADAAIDFQPGFVYTYLSLCLLMPLGPLLIESKKELIRYLAGICSIIAAAFACFLLFPTAVLRPAPGEEAGPVYLLLAALDPPGNAFPSLHAAFAAFSVLHFVRMIGGMGASRPFSAAAAAWGAVIVYSAAATKQHAAADLAAGLLLGCLGYRLFFSTSRRTQ